ncbi:hypothetical protein EIP91_009838 [Steccherinum ochraceum]|uniref:Major facilitator superfamily (MFS) profile domain-containing protein n=1 Tax=Steccherinum ochraceum TaxID=92696 RepID=A0A4R0R164_9APHY|nr:hypothetical protein EIP91_009838 [Steccherinum ochraceum]
MTASGQAEARSPTPTRKPLNGLQRPRCVLSSQNFHFIRIPTYVWCATFTAIGGFLFGFDTGSIGPMTTMGTFQSQFASDSTGTITPTVHGLIVSSILITASISSAISGPLSDRISRTYTISLGAVVFAVGSALVCSARKLAQLFVGRCIAGVGEGLFLSLVTVYAIEISPASVRGRMGSVLQLFITVGIACGYFVCYGTSRFASSLSWRFPAGMQAVVACILAIGAPLLPHSPRSLRHVGRAAEADASWSTLGVNTAFDEKKEENAEWETVPRESFWKDALQMWNKRVRGRTARSLLDEHAAGIWYRWRTLSGLPGQQASFIASGVTGLVNLACTIAAQFFSDTWSRRTSMISGGSIIATCMLVIGTLYATSASDTAAGRWAIIVLIYVFVVAYACTWAIVTRIIASEIQPTRTRAAATSFGQCMNWVVNWIIAFTTPLFLAHSSSGPYFTFGACTLLTTLVCVAFQPETRGASLEEVDKAFEVSPWKAALIRRGHRKRHNLEESLEDDGTLTQKQWKPALEAEGVVLPEMCYK